ncbi:hypothetical protein MAM1_0057d03640 [Mucor ambiguus]|uniref:RING-type domain-containing protein n=1 Tax=Mucor ambiguus TaxID=91626 RepID=A0A0C9LTY9_9FUNG|nr:hypothetical protein MAM1_0057d03640 [Mucor ambiguus]
MEQSSSNIAAAATTTDTPSPRTVRTNWLRFSWNQISGASKVILLISFSLSLVQIAATIAILAIGSSSGISCGKPLQLYLIIFVVRVGLSLPLSIYQHLFTPRGRRRNSRRGRPGNARRRRARQTGNRHGASTAHATTENNVTVATNTSPQDDNHAPQQVGNSQHQQEDDSQNRERPASLISGWTDRVKSLLDLFAILWFIVGNYLIFSPSDCPTTAAPYYYTILTWILLGYLILLIPLLACAAVIFCLPCVLVALRTFSINVTSVMVGGTKEEIAKIPVFKYKASTNPTATADDTAHTQTSANTNDTNTFTTTTAKKSSFIRRIMKRPSYHNTSDQQNQQHAHLDTITIPRAEDAVCSICLGEYETNELICKLWQVYSCFLVPCYNCDILIQIAFYRCQHHYHKDCVHEWLALNSKCPLCKRDFRGKDYVGDSDESDTDDDDEEEQY